MQLSEHDGIFKKDVTKYDLENFKKEMEEKIDDIRDILMLPKKPTDNRHQHPNAYLEATRPCCPNDQLLMLIKEVHARTRKLESKFVTVIDKDQSKKLNKKMNDFDEVINNKADNNCITEIDNKFVKTDKDIKNINKELIELKIGMSHRRKVNTKTEDVNLNIAKGLKILQDQMMILGTSITNSLDKFEKRLSRLEGDKLASLNEQDIRKHATNSMESLS